MTIKMAELRGFEPLSTGRKPAMLGHYTTAPLFFKDLAFTIFWRGTNGTEIFIAKYKIFSVPTFWLTHLIPNLKAFTKKYYLTR
tara:strand:- start:905 stop:1156 length:252 start_codon:yes stop_codon:yes gene_type:complete